MENENRHGVKPGGCLFVRLYYHVHESRQPNTASPDNSSGNTGNSTIQIELCWI